MMKLRKCTSFLLAVVMLVSLCVTAGAQEPAAGEMDGCVVVMHTNDVHGAIDGYAKVAALKESYEARGAYVLLLDAGDFAQGDPAVSESEGAAAVELMNLTGYDLAVPGNHEFDYGYNRLCSLAEEAEFPLAAANVRYQGQAAFPAYEIFTAPSGTKIGVFGLTTPETATKAHPAKIQGVTFLSGQALINCAREQVAALERAGCDYIICLGHLGIDAASAPNRSVDLLEQVEGIDCFIDGHSHSTQADIAAVAPGGTVNGTELTSAGTKLEEVGVITISPDGTASAQTVALADLQDADQAVADRAAAIQKEIDDEYGTVFAKTEVELDGESDHVRSRETNLGNLVADALAWGAREAGEPVDAAVINGGSIRASIPQGGITKKMIRTVLPFGNTLSIVKITGAELLEALEASTYCTPSPMGSFPQVFGMAFSVDTDAAYDSGAEYPNTYYHAPESIQRVHIDSIGEEPFDPDAVYTIATNDFLAAGGDSYYAFQTASVRYDLGLSVDEVVADYITEYLGGTVTYESYALPDGRITLEQDVPFTDVNGADPYYDAVKYCYEHDIFKGITETTFVPNGTMNRGQMITVLWRVSGSPEPAGVAPYADVALDSPFAKAIAWGYEQQLVNGYTATQYQPGQAISKQQFLTILYRYGQMMEYDMSASNDLSMYLDRDTVSAYAREAMEWAVGAHILVEDKALTHGMAAMRWQVAEYIAAFCQNVADTAVTAETAA